MTTTALLYQSGQKWRMGVAFGAAAIIHFAAIAFASLQGSGKTGEPPFTDKFPDIFLEPDPTVTDPTPENPEPLPTHPQTDQSFPEQSSTPPPVRRQANKLITPIQPRNNGVAGSTTLSSAKVLAINAPRPEYPYEARRQRITGHGVVAIRVDSVSGNVSSVSMLRSTGSPFLDNAALTGFRRWRFKPGTVSSVTCPITFTLTGASY